MAKYTRRVDRGREAARFNRQQAARLMARICGARVHERPGFRREPAPKTGPARYGTPRYVRDGNVITLVPGTNSASTSNTGGKATIVAFPVRRLSEEQRYPKRRAA